MALNLENLDKLIATLESVPDGRFDISFYSTGDLLHDCGTAGCIAGWALHLSRQQYYLPSNIAAEWLGINARRALFFPEGYDCSPSLFPRLRAIDVLKHLRETGTVDWQRFPPENYVKAETPPC